MMSINFPISASHFNDQYQEKAPLLMKGAASSTDFSWTDVNEILESSEAISDDLKLSFDGLLSKHEYVESYFDIGTLRYRLIKPVVYDYLRKGATLIVNKIKNEQRVSRYARLVAEFTGRQVVSSAYAAFGSKDSYRAHWDTRDVFAIQLIGRKRWIVYGPSLESPLYTQQSKDYEQQYPCPQEPVMDIVLEPGDVFYLPRGWWHNPLPLGEPTVHLALGTFPAYGMDYLTWTVQQRMQEVLEARRSLNQWETDREAVEAMAREMSALLVEPDNYRRFMDDFIGATRFESPLAVERFGDPNAAPMGEHTRIGLSAHKPHGLADGYVIANGVKLNLDGASRPLIAQIASHPGLSLYDLRQQFPAMDGEKLRRLIEDLCRQDVLAVYPADIENERAAACA